MSISKQEMINYCNENIDKYPVDPLVVEAYKKGYLDVVHAYIHLRLKEKKQTQEQIALEVNLYQSAISKYVMNEIKGITDKIYISLCFERHWNEMLYVFEKDNYCIQLSYFIEECEEIRSNTEKAGRGYYNISNSSKSPDMCRKILKEYLQEKIQYASKEEYEKILNDRKDDNTEEHVLIEISSLFFEKGKYTFEIKGSNKDKTQYTCEKDKLVHNIVKAIDAKIAGYQRLNTIHKKNNDKGSKVKRIYYLSSSKKNRKVKRALEYIAARKENGYKCIKIIWII